MFLKGLTRKFKQRSGRKFLQRELQQAPQAGKQGKGVGSVGVIVDLDAFDQPERFQDLAQDLGLAPNTISVIGYRAYYDKNSPYSTPLFSDKDLGWKGEIENSYAEEFLQREYDLLVNYFQSDALVLKLMSIRTRARINVGLPGADARLNDLILQVPLQELGTFRTELKKYLNVLNELN